MAEEKKKKVGLFGAFKSVHKAVNGTDKEPSTSTSEEKQSSAIPKRVKRNETADNNSTDTATTNNAAATSTTDADINTGTSTANIDADYLENLYSEISEKRIVLSTYPAGKKKALMDKCYENLPNDEATVFADEYEANVEEYDELRKENERVQRHIAEHSDRLQELIMKMLEYHNDQQREPFEIIRIFVNSRNLEEYIIAKDDNDTAPDRRWYEKLVWQNTATGEVFDDVVEEDEEAWYNQHGFTV